MAETLKGMAETLKGMAETETLKGMAAHASEAKQEILSQLSMGRQLFSHL